MRSIPRLCSIAFSLHCLVFPGCTSALQQISGTDSKETDRQYLNDEKDSTAKQSAVKQLQSIKAERMDDWEAVVHNSHEDELISPIKNARQLKQVWSVCNPDKHVPDLDFDRYWVYLHTSDAGDPNGRGMHFDRQADGTIRTRVVSTLIGFEHTDRRKVRFYLVPQE